MVSERVLDAATITQLLEAVSERPTVVLERLPRGGGATNWFRCTTPDALQSVLDVLRPASRVSFYFDDRVAEHDRDVHLYEMAERLLADNGDIVLGTMPVDGLEIAVDFPSSRREVDEHLARAAPPFGVFIGAFPAPDDDGTDSFTALVPDADGTVRHEPH